MRSWERVGLTNNKHWKIFTSRQCLHLVSIITINYEKLGRKNRMTVFKDFLKWYNNKDVVPTLEAMQNLIQFYQNKGIDMLVIGRTLLNLANICQHKSTSFDFYPFCERNKDFCEKIWEDMNCRPSIIFTRKAVVAKIFIRSSSNKCKSIVGILEHGHVFLPGNKTRNKKIERSFTSGKQ